MKKNTKDKIKYPYEVRYSSENIWIWLKKNLGRWKKISNK